MAEPSVSVLVCVYNGDFCVSRALDSAFAQDFKGAEVVVVDDGSTDRTPEVLRGYGDRIRVVRQKNLGLAAARNASVAASRSEYVAILDADDRWLPGRLSKTVAALEREPQAVLAYSDVVPVNDLDQPLSATFVRPDRARAPSMDELLEGWWPILMSAVTIRRGSSRIAGDFAKTTPAAVLKTLTSLCGRAKRAPSSTCRSNSSAIGSLRSSTALPSMRPASSCSPAVCASAMAPLESCVFRKKSSLSRGGSPRKG